MSKNTNSVRFCKQIPAGIYDRFAKYAADGGMDDREAFIALVNQFTPKLRDEPEVKQPQAKPVDPHKRYAELVKQIKPFVEKINAQTITRRELVAMAPISQEIYEVKQAMGVETTYLDRVAQFDERRAEAEATIKHMESELEQLQAISRVNPLDSTDTQRYKELLQLIPQHKRDLDIEYPL